MTLYMHHGMIKVVGAEAPTETKAVLQQEEQAIS
jgi:hypothetical protein